MAFNESLKKEVRRKSGYTCALCHSNSISIEIHHIIPQEAGGPDTLENAVALCPTCHSDLGNNPEKRTRIKEKRDWWYEIVKSKYPTKELDLFESLDKKLTDVSNNLPAIKKDLVEYFESKIGEITVKNAPVAVSSISSIISGIPSRKELIFRNGAYWEEGDSEPLCSRCWEVDQRAVHMHPMGNPAFYQCPNCKSGSVKARPDRDDPPQAITYRPVSFR